MIETATLVTLDDLLAILFPEEPSRLLRLVAESRRDFGDLSYFFAYRRGRWCWPPDASVNADTPALCVARNRDTQVTWSPLLYLNSPMPSAPALLPLVWTCLPLRIEPSKFDPSMGAVDPESERSALARIAAVSPEPTAVIHEGRRITCMWKLAQPLPAPIVPVDETRAGPSRDEPAARAQRALWAMALKVGGDRNALDPRRESFSVPRMRMANVYPTRLVEVMLSSNVDRTFDVDELL